LDKSQCAESKDDKARMQNVPYASAVGYIMYAVRCTRPDVAFAQNITSRFQQSPEAEYIAAAEAAKETVGIKKFVDELGVIPSNNYPIEMNCDNTAAISMAKEPGIMKGARHFQRKFHYVRECVDTGEIEMVKVHTDDTLADPFTKALAGHKLTRHARSMCLRPASSFM
nr:putative Gag-Pol polyprotein [Tanacetum cinerariifolium]